ncbi:TetR family transcriptional regulator [Methylophaga marina]|uniref:TetR/AcrR family transcriptional regulator n=1 Tax=Methylophaga marina TaxID=45495 RepID=A0ABP3CYK8_9GAMM|nr:TetR/AcrR family transcriptional regulator [Methylophaga marina]BDZ72516.1 TetR family transcriptional regulator [Methylophaga marina]
MTQTNKPRSTDTRHQILSTAQQIILGKGFAAVGLNEILKAANVPKGSFYHYFESKEHFGTALLEHYFEQYIAGLDTQLKADKRPAVERLIAYFEQWKSNQCNDTSMDRCLVVKLSGEVTDLSESMRLTLKKGTQQVIEHLAMCVQAAKDNDEIKLTADAQTVTEELYYLWIGATLMTKVNHTPAALELAMSATLSKLGLPNHN